MYLKRPMDVSSKSVLYDSPTLINFLITYRGFSKIQHSEISHTHDRARFCMIPFTYNLRRPLVLHVNKETKGKDSHSPIAGRRTQIRAHVDENGRQQLKQRSWGMHALMMFQ